LKRRRLTASFVDTQLDDVRENVKRNVPPEPPDTPSNPVKYILIVVNAWKFLEAISLRTFLPDLGTRLFENLNGATKSNNVTFCQLLTKLLSCLKHLKLTSCGGAAGQKPPPNFGIYSPNYNVLQNYLGETIGNYFEDTPHIFLDKSPHTSDYGFPEFVDSWRPGLAGTPILS
jgi:hypothetical protein